MRISRKAKPKQGVADWLGDFLQSLTKADLSPRSVEAYRRDLELFHRWFRNLRDKDARWQTLSSIDLISYRQHLVTVERRKPSTVNRRLHSLRRFCRWARNEGLLDEDPSADVKTIRDGTQRRPQGLHQSEVHALLRVAGESGRGHAKRNYALAQFFLQTGVRLNEAASMCIADATIRARTGVARVREGKGRKQREVPLNATARRALRRYLDSRSRAKPDDPLFESGRGSRLSARSIQNTISELARRAKITRLEVSPHTLRHTFALWYLRDNPGKLVELANLLGHESLDTTAIYTQPSRDDLQADLERSSLNVYDD